MPRDSVADRPLGAHNTELAKRLNEYADLLEQQNGDRFRVAAYRHAAATLESLETPASAILSREGIAGLEALPTVGPAIAAALSEMLTTGRWSQLERLRGTLDPERLFRSLPGIGPALAARLHDVLGVETLEDLEAAAHDGRLAAVPGVGPRRSELLKVVLAERLRPGRQARTSGTAHRPPVALLLDIDSLYRERAARHDLPTIAPRRFNPERRAWLPVMHERRDGWDFTALFSNTGLAHELGRIGDWVVIYYQSDSKPEGQCTVVGETRAGPLRGRRVVRGREAACLRHYEVASTG